VSDLEHAQAEAVQKAAATEALRLSLQRAERDLNRAIEDRRVRREKLRSDAADVEAAAASAAGAAARLRDEGRKYVIRAPIPGRLGEIAALRAGSFVKAGDRLGTVVPEGGIRVIAEFAPTDVAGRIGPGSPARVRLDGFPWIQYGHLLARVERVATELRDGRLRVELALVPGQKTSIPLQHGLPGTAEIEAERLSPAALVLRSAGRALDASGSSSASAAPTPTPAPGPS
jgi:membrane fusion protein (multidrug efflux system)